MNELFLSLKYKGVKAPWEILDNATQYGWSCRKWIRHQSSATDKKALKEFADSLIDSGTLRLALLPQINCIAEKVQRWRKDASNFSLEPDERDEFKELRRYLALARENPAAMLGVLRSDFKVLDAQSIQLEALPLSFKQLAVARFFKKVRGIETSIARLLKDAVLCAATDIDELLADFGSPHRGAVVDRNNLADWVLNEIGLSAELVAPSALPQCGLEDRRLVFLETGTASKSQLCAFEYRQGKVYVRANTEHLFIKALNDHQDLVRTRSCFLLVKLTCLNWETVRLLKSSPQKLALIFLSTFLELTQSWLRTFFPGTLFPQVTHGKP